jgi:Sensors of blue-light using FAD
MKPLSSLLYISLAPSSADEETVQHILATSRRRNAALGVSGALLKYAGYYLQVLEGDHEAVHQLYRRIRLDARHFDARVAAVETVTERQFSGWAMRHVPAPRSTDRAVGEFLRGLWRGNRGIEAHTARALLRRLANASSANASSANASSASAAPASAAPAHQ